MSELELEPKKGLKAYVQELPAMLAGVGIIAVAYLVMTNKIPAQFRNFYAYFYVLAVAGALGLVGEKVAVTLLAFVLPVLLGGATVAMKFKPEKYPIEDWWEIYSLVVLFSAGYLVFLFVRWEQTKKLKDGEGGAMSARRDPRAAAKFREEQSRREAAKTAGLDSALGISGEKKEKKLKGSRSAEPEEPADPNETAEQRMEREMRRLKDDFNRKSMRLSTTLMRMKSLAKSLDRDEIFANILEIVSKGMDADRVQLLLNDEKEGQLRVVRAEGMAAKEYRDLVVSYEENSIIAFLARQGGANEVVGGSGAVGIKECELDPKMASMAGQGVLKTILAAPIYVEGKVFGIINVEKMKNPDYTRDDQNLVATCGDVAGLVMKNAKLYSATMDDLLSAKKLSEEQLAQNEQLKGSLSRIVSPSVAEMILQDPNALRLGGNKCIVTMFFSDIRGFTKMSENMDPTDIVGQLNVYFTRMTDILMELDGTLDKYVGDELMALFGAPVGRPDDPIRAVLCGLRMLEALCELQVVWEKEGKPVIKIGLGINTGEVTAGYMGSEKQLSYTVIGDNVNLAARVMANAKPMELLITRATYDLVKDYFEVEVREPIMVKGKSMPIEIFLVTGVKPESNLEQVLTSNLGAGAIVKLERKPDIPTKVMGRELTQEEMKQNIKIDDKPKVIECANCGTENDAQTKFCTKCGMPIF
jgi:class 3 adenylate cyclase